MFSGNQCGLRQKITHLAECNANCSTFRKGEARGFGIGFAVGRSRIVGGRMLGVGNEHVQCGANQGELQRANVQKIR